MYTYNRKLITLSPGYYTFNDIKNALENYDGVKLAELSVEGKCILSTNDSAVITLNDRISKLLGFDTRIFTAGLNIISGGLVNVNLGLEYIKIKCDIVDGSHNINEAGRKDDTVVSLPITTEQTLFGTIAGYTDIESKVLIDKGVISQIRFNVTDQNGRPINIGKILLEVYIG